MICYLLLVSRCQTSCGNLQGYNHKDEGAVLNDRNRRINIKITIHQSDSYQSEKNPRFFDSAAVAQETDDEDKSSSSNQQIGTLGDNCWLYQILCDTKNKYTDAHLSVT